MRSEPLTFPPPRDGSAVTDQARRRRYPRRVDWFVAIGCAVLQALGPRTGGSASASSAWVGPVALVLAIGQGLPLAWRRSTPRSVAVCVLGCYGLSGVVVGLVPPYAAWAATWTLATSNPDRRRATYLAIGAALATGMLIVVTELRWEGSGASGLLVAVTVVVTLGAVLVRSERSRIDAVGRMAAAQERLRIAGELHDVVGHGLSAIAVQSSTARMALEVADHSTVRTSLVAVETSSRAAMREMRQMLGILREDAEVSTEPGTGASRGDGGLTAIAELVDNVRAGGFAVDFVVCGDAAGTSAGVQQCAYRVVQEALTNAVKHAPGAHIAVRVAASEGALRLTVETVGGTPSTPGVDSGGLGLNGILRRVATAGGEAHIGPTPTGFLVEAELPKRRVSSR
jgi:signal transduction histidine kinase